MKPETVKLVQAIIMKACQAGWITVQEAEALDLAVEQQPKKRSKKVKSPELGT